MEDYTCLLDSIQKLIISGYSSNYLKGIPEKHVLSYIELERILDKEKRMLVFIDNLNIVITGLSEGTLNDDSTTGATEVTGNDCANESSDKNLLQSEAQKIAKQWVEVAKPLMLLLEEGSGQKALDSLCGASKLQNVCRISLILCLLLIIKEASDKKLVSSAYSAIPEVCSTSRSFFLFLQMNKMYSLARNSNGFGRGLKRVVHNWYARQDPLLLALEVTRHAQDYTWSHRDVIKLAHLKLKELPFGTQIILYYVLFGLEKTKESFSSQSDASRYLEILEFLHIKKNGATSATEMVKRAELITKEFKCFTLIDFPSQVLHLNETMNFILTHGSPKVIIEALTETDLIQYCASDLERKILLFSALKSENLDPLSILIAYNVCRRKAASMSAEGQTQKSRWLNAKPLVSKAAKVNVPRVPKEEFVGIIEFLGHLLVTATTEFKRTERKASIFIDTNPAMRNFINISLDKSPAKQIKGIQACSLILLSLASSSRFDMVHPIFFSATGLEKPKMPKPCYFQFLQTKLKCMAVAPVKVKEALDYAVENQQDTCIIICYSITDEIVKVAHKCIGELKDNGEPLRTRLIICGVEEPEGAVLPLPEESVAHPELLLLYGFNRNTLPAISAFHENIF